MSEPLIPIGGRIVLSSTAADIDYYYGPYEATDGKTAQEVAFDTLNDDGVLAVGRTVGIVNALGEVEEWWFKDAADVLDDLVRKGVTTAQVQSQIDESLAPILNDLYPLVAAYGPTPDGCTDSGKFEYGTSVRPGVSFLATRNGVEVTPISVDVSPNTAWGFQSGNTYAATSAEVLIATKTVNVGITQGGQTANTGDKSWQPTFYRYKGAVDSTEVSAAIIKSLPKELSTVTTLGATALAAHKSYIFAVKSNTPVNLVVRHAVTDFPIDGAVTGTITLEQENGFQSNTYYYVVVPASADPWSFKITNN